MATEPVSSTIRASKPVDWYARESLTLLAPGGGVNVIVSSEPVDPAVDSSTYAHIQGQLLQGEFPGYSEHSFESRQVFGERAGFVRRFSWQPADGAPVTQVQHYYAEGGKGYLATATTPRAHFTEHETVVVELLDSLRV